MKPKNKADMDKITKSASVTPILYVSDMEKSFNYYVDKLKFIKAWDWGEPVSFGSVYFGDAVELFFCLKGQGHPGSWMSIFIADVDAYQKIIKEAGADIVYGPLDEPHGMREMHVKDPDGNIIRFSSAIETVTMPVKPANT